MYEERLRQIDVEAAKAAADQSQFLLAILISAGATLYMLFSHLGGFLAVLPLAVIAYCVRLQMRANAEVARNKRLKAFYQRGMDRVNDDWIGKGHTGEEYREGGHLYDLDLNILGTGSLFELLSTARTEIGRRRLASYLLHPASAEEAQARQVAVQELRDLPKLREAMVLLGKYDFSNCDEDAFHEWLKEEPKPFPRYLPFLLALSPLALMVMGFAGLFNFVPWTAITPWAFPLIGLQAATGFMLQERVKPILQHSRELAAETGILGEGLRLLASHKFNSPKLAALVKAAESAPGPMRQIERRLQWVRERDKDWLYPLSIYTLLGTQLAIAVERWRAEHREQMRAWIDAWGEFEALQSLATHAHEHPSDVFPTFATEGVLLDGEGVGHPLISESRAVRNDVRFSPEQPFWIISGSNMAGKSTLLRSIGTNAVLAMAGAPARATRLHLSPLRVCASIAPADSLLEGKSRFMAEVERIRDTLAAAASTPTLFVIDEIFSGTNSTDRRIAAEAVARALIENSSIGALSTHDLALTEIASLQGLRGRNVHMCSRDDADALDFDYLVKSGINRQSNALAIARLAGVRV